MTTPAPTCDPRPPDTGAAFATTRWTLVRRAAGSDTTEVRVALEELCRAYWRPVYAFVRRLGRNPHDAQDLTQEFFARLLAGPALGGVAPEKGRFRSFLLAALKHFLANEWDKARALKRGGGIVIVPLDAADTDAGLPGLEVSAPESGAERAWDRQWALTLLERVLDRLRDEHGAAGKSEQFDCLRPTLTAERNALPYAEIGRRLGLSEGAVKVAVHRLRARYRELLRLEVAGTLEEPGQVEAELRELFRALSG